MRSLYCPSVGLQCMPGEQRAKSARFLSLICCAILHHLFDDFSCAFYKRKRDAEGREIFSYISRCQPCSVSIDRRQDPDRY